MCLRSKGPKTQQDDEADTHIIGFPLMGDMLKMSRRFGQTSRISLRLSKLSKSPNDRTKLPWRSARPCRSALPVVPAAPLSAAGERLSTHHRTDSQGPFSLSNKKMP